MNFNYYTANHLIYFFMEMSVLEIIVHVLILFLGTVGHHEKNYPVEKLDVSYDGSLIASISHDNCVKFWSIKYLEEMDYNKTKKPFLQQKGGKMRRKENKMQRAQESEHQLPSSNKSNQKDFFKDLDE